MLEIKGTFADIRRLFIEAAVEEGKVQATNIGRDVVKGTVRRTRSAWVKFLKRFKFRSRRKSEKPAAYMSARTKAASRAYRKLKKVKK